MESTEVCVSGTQELHEWSYSLTSVRGVGLGIKSKVRISRSLSSALSPGRDSWSADVIRRQV